MSDGHLYLCCGVRYVGDTHRSWYDSTHQSVLLLTASSLKLLPLNASHDPNAAATFAVSLPTDMTTLYDFNEPQASDDHQEAIQQRNSTTPIMQLQLSVDGQFLAIQRSDIEVQVVHRATRTSYWVLCRSMVGNRILHRGVIWNTHSAKSSSSQDLFLVTKLGLEHYRVSFKRRSCRLHRTVGLYVHEFWYAASHGVLLLSSGSRANEVVPFFLHGTNVEKLPKLVFSTSVGKQDLHLVTLYGDMYAIYNDHRSTKLLLYLVGKTKVTCVRSLNLMLPPGTALGYSVVDNLLVCHSLDFNVSLFFDIKCDGSISDPFSAPLPISSRPPGCPLTELETASAEASFDIVKDFDAAVRGVNEEDDQEAYDDSVPSSPTPPRSIRRALSVNDKDLHRSFIDNAVLPPHLLVSSPASRLASRRSARRLQRAMSAASVEKLESTKLAAVVPSFSRWQFHAPNFVQRSCLINGLEEQVEIRKLHLNLAEICTTCERHCEILPFLLRRGDDYLAKMLVLKLVRSHIVEQQSSLSTIVHLLATVQTMSGTERHNKSVVGGEALSSSQLMHSNDDVNAVRLRDEYSAEPVKAREIARNSKGFFFIQQTEFYHHVWKNILEDTDATASCNLSVYIVEYIKNLRERKVQVENITYIALAECFIATGEPDKLYQFLHYHVLADSIELAELMVRNGETYPALMQMGLDMYFRLKEICPLLHTLLELGQTERAIEIAWRNRGLTSCDVSSLPGVVFFDSLVKSVTSSKQPRSPFQMTQMLGNLLLFLRVWDPAALTCSSTSSFSILATRAAVPFPDEMLLPSSRLKLREAFGFR